MRNSGRSGGVTLTKHDRSRWQQLSALGAALGRYGVVVGLPAVIVLFVSLSVFAPNVFERAFRYEGPIEWAQSILFLWTAIALAIAARSSRQHIGVRACMVGAMLLALFVLGEELSWGQQLGLGVETSSSWREINVQGESNLHNLAYIQRYRHFSYLLIAVVGLGFMLLYKTIARVRRSWVSELVLPRFLVVAFVVMIAAFILREWMYQMPDIQSSMWQVDRFARSFAEVGELAIAAAGFAYATHLWELTHRRPSADVASLEKDRPQTGSDRLCCDPLNPRAGRARWRWGLLR